MFPYIFIANNKFSWLPYIQIGFKDDIPNSDPSAVCGDQGFRRRISSIGSGFGLLFNGAVGPSHFFQLVAENAPS